MARKKDFTADAAGVFVDKMVAPPKKQAAAEPKQLERKNARQRTNAANTEVKITFMLDKELEAKARYICFAERYKMKDVLNAAVELYAEQYEDKYGSIDV
jgi:hypothetical protein